MLRLLLGLCFWLALADGPDGPAITTTSTTSYSDPIVLVYAEHGCVGPAVYEINLAHHRAAKCSTCFDRCEGNLNGLISYRLIGSGRAAIAWNCVGMSDYNNAGFERGGIFDSSGCHSPGGGGTVVLCSSSFEKASTAVELAEMCNLTFPNIGVSLSCFKRLSVALLAVCMNIV
jgi:hypothetical protein